MAPAGQAASSCPVRWPDPVAGGVSHSQLLQTLDSSARHHISCDLPGLKLGHASKAHLLRGLRRTDEAKSGWLFVKVTR